MEAEQREALAPIKDDYLLLMDRSHAGRRASFITSQLTNFTHRPQTDDSDMRHFELVENEQHYDLLL